LSIASDTVPSPRSLTELPRPIAGQISAAEIDVDASIVEQ
jgi:hypothetical protein